MEEFLIRYGLLAVFCCAVVENDVTFVLTGVVIHLGFVHPLAVVYAVAGALLHDSIWFWVGHVKSESIRTTRVYRRVQPAVERFAERFGPWELFFCRFIYGTRTPSIVFWGVQRLPLMKFLLIEALALSVWGGALAAVGFILSDSAEAVIGRVHSLERWLLGALVLVVLWVLGARVVTRYELRKRLARQREAGE